MSCTDFDRWLDDGRPEAEAPARRAHAGLCPRCGRALRAALELDDALARPVPDAAPGGFTGEVLRRVRIAEDARAAAAGPDAFRWGLRAAADPRISLALLLCALLAWRGRALWALAAGWAERFAPLASGLRVPATPVLTDPAAQLGLWLVVTPVMMWLAWTAWRWLDRTLDLRPLVGAR